MKKDSFGSTTPVFKSAATDGLIVSTHGDLIFLSLY